MVSGMADNEYMREWRKTDSGRRATKLNSATRSEAYRRLIARHLHEYQAICLQVKAELLEAERKES